MNTRARRGIRYRPEATTGTRGHGKEDEDHHEDDLDPEEDRQRPGEAATRATRCRSDPRDHHEDDLDREAFSPDPLETV